MLGTRDGVDRALQLVAEGRRPVVVADVWDNPGGGTAGDGTLILREMMTRPGLRLAVATIWDPMAVTFARGARRGRELTMRIGGKSCAPAGEPTTRG